MQEYFYYRRRPGSLPLDSHSGVLYSPMLSKLQRQCSIVCVREEKVLRVIKVTMARK